MANAPLIISDRRSVMSGDLIEVDKVLSDKIEKAYYVKYLPYHQWYYMSEQKKEDLALFKTQDSERNEVNASMLSYDKYQ